MSKELEDKRKEEIVEACAKLYKTKNFKEITIKDISEATTFSRPSIYNYFQTKEEIFLELLKKEYCLWCNQLEDILQKNDSMTVERFADTLATTLKNRKRMLKLLSMNIYDIEENSRLELLVEFKKVFGKSMSIIKKYLDKYFSQMTEKEKTEFMYAFFPFMYGIYPYTVVTDKQKKAMEIAGLEFIKYYSIYDITYNTVLIMLEKYKER